METSVLKDRDVDTFTGRIGTVVWTVVCAPELRHLRKTLGEQARGLWNWRYLALACVGLFLVRTYWQRDPSQLTAAAYWISLLAVLLWFLHRFSLLKSAAAILLLCGFVLNAVVTLANGGFMPIEADMPHGIYEPLTEDTKLRWLADVLPLKSSIGDWLVGAGLLALTRTIVKRRHSESLSI